MKMTRILVAAVAALGLSGIAWASTAGQRAPEHHHWHNAGPFGTFDRQALQRGLQIYQEVCSSCHSLDLVHFRNLGEPGGPFESEEFPNANDNAIVMQIAAGYMIEDGPDDAGDMFERAGLPSDAFPAPFANPQQARGSNGGALPPDLSLIVKARSHGADYIRSLLLGYGEEVPHDVTIAPGKHYNPYFAGAVIAMAPPLSEGLITYADGTEPSMEQMAEDVVTFLTWAGDPHMEARKQMGVMVLIYLFIFAILVYLAYRQIWANVKH
ncbi:cytochrome c1 [Maricaulis sp.]|uniref:cytochrome c1 n=1 Tax=Maricaulis sp. TaxID=1486257 RepID=UPI003A904ECD